MSDKSAIEWTDATWNPTTGCDQVSPGCDNCYALTLAARLKAMGNPRYQNDGSPKTSGPGFGLTLHPDKLEDPLKWRTPRRVFVNSMSDLFHDYVPDQFIARVFSTMGRASKHSFQELTKRPRRMQRWVSRCGPVYFSDEEKEKGVRTWITHNGHPPSSYGGDGILVGVSESWPLPNVWLGTSVEDQKRADLRIPHLLATPAAVRFLSCEPLLGPVDLSKRVFVLGGAAGPIHWVIAGGESGPNRRPLDKRWLRTLRDQCDKAGVAFFLKQGAALHPGQDRELDGRTWDEMPEAVPA